MIGSAKLADIHYISDYDLEEFIDETNKDYQDVLLSLFQKKLKKQKRMKIFPLQISNVAKLKEKQYDGTR